MGKQAGGDILSVAEAGRMLNVSPRQVRNLIADGLLPAEKVGRDFIIRRPDVLKVPKVRKPGPKPRDA